MIRPRYCSQFWQDYGNKRIQLDMRFKLKDLAESVTLNEYATLPKATIAQIEQLEYGAPLPPIFSRRVG
jgi:hypothetical protein